ncbi:alpha-glucan family phosphorylase [Methylotuvimicrobium buryatense]|uniref:Alpha-glucan family phosphorylase n=1 Tax=Methylotuvimicrobium buryatense TaxID=95641 RepID=A0A4P9UV22_METBY|nr:alpha-glucan family phosphorylase [Methylotuvimicrobium buryatense]QCW84600.1 alpha-glucan family phosphorylase [Methylotuvimicrobium buryatense]
MTAPRFFTPELSQKLDGLSELALDCNFSWSHRADEIWHRLNSSLWEQSRNPWLVLQACSANLLQELADNEEFCRKLQSIVAEHRASLAEPRWYQNELEQSTKLAQIAYFSMEFGLSEALPIYSGGLGLLAGDHLKAANDLGIPLVGVGLLYQNGYFRQAFDDDGNQIALYPNADTGDLPICPVRKDNGEWLRIKLNTPSKLWIRVWQAQIGRITLYLLDSNDPVNHPVDRCITSELYGGGLEIRLAQEILLGIGGWRVLRALGIKPEVCHLNEGHAAFLVLERARDLMKETGLDFKTALNITRAGNLFTTHTPVEAGFDRFSPELIGKRLGNYAQKLDIDIETLLNLGRNPDLKTYDKSFNMAYLAIHGSAAVNGVSRLHGEVSRRIFSPLFPNWPAEEIPIDHITNGVYVPAWDSQEADELWTGLCGKNRWVCEYGDLPDQFKRVTNEQLWNLRAQNRKCLVEFVRAEYSRELDVQGNISKTERKDQVLRLFDPNVMTIGFARRFATYKRPNLLLTDPDRLAAILTNPNRPVQLVISGKAHPADLPGQVLIRAWHEFIRRPEIRERAIFLSDYDMITAEYLVQGVDLWINTPRRPWEACGTSGMKILVNGGLNLSELDGWWAEAYRPEVGWSLNGQEVEQADHEQAEILYRLLEQEIVPMFYERDQQGLPRRWLAIMRESMATLTPYFSANRMVREYTSKFYLPLAESYCKRLDGNMQPGKQLIEWLKRIEDLWAKIHVDNVVTEIREKDYAFSMQVYLGELNEEDVCVELFAESSGEGRFEIHSMAIEQELAGAINGYIYSATIPKTRPISDYTPRIRPGNPDCSLPLEANQIYWVQARQG